MHDDEVASFTLEMRIKCILCKNNVARKVKFLSVARGIKLTQVKAQLWLVKARSSNVNGAIIEFKRFAIL